MLKKLLIILGFITSLLPVFGGIEMLQNVTTKNTIFPIYDKGELKAILFGEEVARVGKLIEVVGPMVDIAKAKVDINLIKAGKAEVYKLNSDLDKVVDFWKPRIVFSDGVAVSSFAEVDQATSQAFGKEEIFFRSPALDIDGKGYHVNYKDSTCLIRSNVKIVARNGASDVRNILAAGKLPDEFDLVNAKSEELFIDLKKNYVVLTKNVVVKQAEGTIYCDKMTIFLSSNDDDDTKSDGGTIGMGGSSAKVSEIICTGNVRIIQDAKNQKKQKNSKENETKTFNFFGSIEQDARQNGLEMVYCAKDNSENVKDAKTIQIETTTIGADNLKWNFAKELITFDGDVKLRDKDMDLDCQKLELKLTKDNGKTVIKEIISSGKVKLINKENDLYCDKLTLYLKQVQGKNDPQKAIAIGNVKIIMHNEKDKTVSTLNSHEGYIFFEEDRAEFIGNVKVVDKDLKLDSDKLDIYAKKIANVDEIFPKEEGMAPSRIRINRELELERIVATDNVKIEKINKGEDNEVAYGQKSVYVVKDQKIVLTGTPAKPPVLVKGKNTLRARKNGRVYVDLKEESAYVEDGADLEIRDSKGMK